MAPSTTVFIGTGAIGLPMARRIAGGGHEVVAVEPGASARARASAAGLEVRDLADVHAELAVVMVASSDQLASVVDVALDLEALPAPTWVVMSTVGRDALRREAERLMGAGVVVLDAPVTGGVAGAERGELTIFAAGPAAARQVAAPVLACLGTTLDVGPDLGSGQSLKVVNQHLCSVHLVAAAEALSLAEALGLDRSLALEAVGRGAGGSWMLGDRGPRMLADTDVEVSSAIDIFVKDSGLVADASRDSGAHVPLLDAARQQLLAAAEAGLGGHDDSRVIETYQEGRP